MASFVFLPLKKKKNTMWRSTTERSQLYYLFLSNDFWKAGAERTKLMDEAQQQLSRGTVTGVLPHLKRH